jgi:hypothetical protein
MTEVKQEPQIGEMVDIVYSDHEHYIFDNPVGQVVSVDPGEDEDDTTWVTVMVEARVPLWRIWGYE